MRFTVIGGDMRALCVCSLLLGDGHEVRTFALERAEPKPPGMARSVYAAVQGASCVILPLPAALPGGLLNAPLSAGEYPLGEILDALTPGTPVCAGMAGEELLSMAGQRGIELFDYLKREDFAVNNAVATAEGALDIIIRETASTICGARILVIGFGRIGKVLSHRLRGLGAHVTASARSFGDLAWIKAYGFTPADTGALDGILDGFDVVVNTVPAMVLDEGRLSRLPAGALCVDLASKPGGVDFAAASRLGVRAVWALSLPGKTAPESAGSMIRDSVYNILKEMDA